MIPGIIAAAGRRIAGGAGASSELASSEGASSEGGGGDPTLWDATLKGGSITLSNGDQDATKETTGYQTVYATKGKSSGIYAFECLVVSRPTASSILIGFADKANSGSVITTYLGNNGGAVETIGYNDHLSTGRIFRKMTVGNDNGTSTADYDTSEIVTVSLDFDTNTASFYVNGVLSFTRAFTSGFEYFPAVSVQLEATVRIIGSGLTYLPSGASEWDAA